jgi:two-component sensor histidine kinase
VRLPRFLLVFAVWLGVVSVFMLQRLVGEAFRDGPIPTGGLVLEVVYWIPWLLLAPVLILLARRFPITHQSWRRNIPVHLVAGLAFALVEAIASALAERGALALIGMPGGPRRLMPLGAAWAVYTVVAMWKYWAFLGIWSAFAAARRSRDRELEAAKLESQLTAARLQALHNRLHPHFLFNALHSASMLALVDPEAANRTLARLADLLRDTLREQPDADVSLARELETIQRYLDVERVRFPDRLHIDVDVEPAALKARIPTLLLQPLVENAVRHGIAATTEAGHLVIRGRREGARLVLEVEDDGPGLPGEFRLASASGVGLGATAARLALLHPGNHQLELANRDEGGCRATVTLPFRAA